MSVQIDVSKLFVELVAKEMVACGEVKWMPGHANRWRVDCTLYRPGNKERAKAAIADFLRQAWSADDIKFNTKKGASPWNFCVTFRSDVF